MGSLSGIEVEMGEIRVAQLDCAIGDKNSAQDAMAPAPEMSEIKLAQLDCAIGEENSSQLPPRLLLDAALPALEVCEIKIDQLDCAIRDKNLAQLPRRLLPEAAAPAPVASKKGCGLRKWRRAQRQLRNNALDLNVDFLVLATGYSLGIGSKNHEDCGRKRIRAKKCSMKGLGHRMHRRALGDKGEVFSVGSDLRKSDAGHVFGNRKHTVMSMSYDGEQSEDRQSEEVQSANESDEDLASEHLDMGRPEHTEERGGRWVVVESIASLQTMQEVLESEVQKLSELGKESEIEDSRGDNKERDVIGLPDVEDDVFELNEKMKHLEQKLEEASTIIREKDIRLTKLQGLLNRQHFPKVQMEDTDNDLLETELECLLQEKMGAEIQCLVMAKASQSWQFQAEDRIAFLEEHKSLAGDNARTMLMLRDTENKVLVLKEQVEKLEIHEKELFGMTEILRMQNRTCKISLISFIQLIMLCISLWMFFMQMLPPFGEVVPT